MFRFSRSASTPAANEQPQQARIDKAKRGTGLFAFIRAVLGYLFTELRTRRLAGGSRNATTDPSRGATGDKQAQRDIADHAQDTDWSRVSDDDSSERAHALERASELLQERANALLGFSHDLRGPLQVVQFGAEVMRTRCVGDEYLAGVAKDMDQAIDRMRRLLAELVETACSQRAALPFLAQRLGVADLTVRLRRRLQALVHGREIGTTVVVTANTPDSIEIDPLVLDRILDNLLTNAAKYTERGTIVVELDGAPGFLVLQVSDTGCGIEPEAIGRIFEPGGSRIDARRGDSFGVGLSVVMRLLEQLGGRLEVMSKPGEGTTFWTYLPLRARVDDTPSGMRRRSSGEVPLRPVVRVPSRSA